MALLKIIVNGDDFGQSHDVNSCIEHCHKNGILSSTSLVAGGKSFDDAVNIAKRNPKLDIGVHLCIDEFEPLCNELSSIIDPNTKHFYSKEIAAKYVKFFKYRNNDLVREYSLQIEKVLDNGITITHLDHHHHFHLYWPLLDAIVKVSKRYNIKHIRSQKLIHTEKNIFNKLYRFGHQLYLKSRVATTDGYFDLDPAYREFDKMYERINKLINSSYRVVEIVSHPCAKNAHQVELLTNEKVINLLKSCDLVKFGEL